MAKSLHICRSNASCGQPTTTAYPRASMAKFILAQEAPTECAKRAARWIGPEIKRWQDENGLAATACGALGPNMHAFW
jgi:hypothetical protein